MSMEPKYSNKCDKFATYLVDKFLIQNVRSRIRKEKVVNIKL